jgi:hypothetical protein
MMRYLPFVVAFVLRSPVLSVFVDMMRLLPVSVAFVKWFLDVAPFFSYRHLMSILFSFSASMDYFYR